MTKIQLIKFSNLALFLSVAAQGLIGIVLFFEIKPLDGPAIDQVHAYNGFLLMILAGLHVALHWPAVKGLFFRKK